MKILHNSTLGKWDPNITNIKTNLKKKKSLKDELSEMWYKRIQFKNSLASSANTLDNSYVKQYSLKLPLLVLITIKFQSKFKWAYK